MKQRPLFSYDHFLKKFELKQTETYKTETYEIVIDKESNSGMMLL